MSKQQLREQLKQTRLATPTIERHRHDAVIRTRVLALPEVIQSRSIFCFISFADEVDTHQIIRELQQQGKIVLVPKILNNRKMAAILFSSWSELATDSFGILVPSSSEPYLGDIDICLTPGLGFSPSGQRIGYGRGYYDTWFKMHPAVPKFALAYDCQVLPYIPVDNTDVPVDKIVTEKTIYASSQG